MAWNPSPEVQVARDAATAIGKVTKATIDMCVVTWFDNQSRAGYASYGRTSVLCGMARRVADVAYEAINDSEKFDAICHAVTRGNERATDGSGIDFDGLEAEVVGKLRLLKASLRAEMDQTTRTMIVRDLVLPAAELLARFCACVNIEEPQPLDGHRDTRCTETLCYCKNSLRGDDCAARNTVISVMEKPALEPRNEQKQRS